MREGAVSSTIPSRGVPFRVNRRQRCALAIALGRERYQAKCELQEPRTFMQCIQRCAWDLEYMQLANVLSHLVSRYRNRIMERSRTQY
jgi:hypothetical protein